MRYLSLVFVLSLIGCGVKAPIEGRQDPYGPSQIQYTDEDLRTHTAVGTPVLSRDGSGLLHVNVPIRAATNKQLYIDYRISFFDRGGQPLSQSGWLSKTLAPNVFDQITANSMSPLATDFQVDLRYTRVNR
jgi:hypothetical protein